MNIELWLAPSFSVRLCLTLLYSLGQMTLLALLAWSLIRMSRRRSVEASYAVYLTAFIMGLVALPITFAVVDVPEPPLVARDERIITSVPEDASLVTAVHSRPTTPAETSNELASVRGDATVPVPDVSDPSAIENSAIPSSTDQKSDLSAGWYRAAVWVAVVYAVGVLAMLARLVSGLWYAHRLAANAQALRGGSIAALLPSLARQWGLRITPVLAVAERVVVPTVVGLVRPTILLPASALTGLTIDELRLILAHELAHIRRHDLWVNVLQRVAETLLFFNPALWYVSRRLSTLRELCCDELTCRTMAQAGTEPRARYAAALVRVAELSRSLDGQALPTRTDKQSELAALAASGRSPSELRRRVAHVLGEPIRESVRLSPASLLVILAMALLVGGMAAWPSNSGGTAIASEENDTFELIVVGPNGRPVPNANVELRTRPLPTAAQITVGEFVRQGTYGTMVTTNAEGRLVVVRPDPSSGFNVRIKTPGYGPYWAKWNPDKLPQPIPSRFVAELDEGWMVGGMVVNSQGEPIAGAAVRPSVRFKKRPGDTGDLGVGTRIVTDADGKWRFDSVPVSMNEVFVEISHPDFMPNRRALTRSEFGLTRAELPAAVVELQRGLVVRGRVTDESGHPVSDALLRTKFLNDIREARTDADGNYELIGCEPKMARIVVSAPGHATDLREVRVDPDMERVDFVMQPGGKIRVRVVDEQDNGIPRARIFFQGWRGRFNYFEFDHVSQYADENGVWEWHEAPLDEFQADICRPGGMQLSRQSLMARDEEYIFSPPPPLVVSGSVVDAATKQPIEKFRVIPGLRNLDPEIRMNWITREAFDASAGEYRVVFSHDYPAHLVRIEAEGYRVAISRDIKSDEGDVIFDFELRPAEDIAATIVTPFGEPASGAKIALGVAGSQISIRNGDIDDGSTYATRLDADADGHFRIPDRGEAFQLVMTHSSGFAYLKPDEQEIPRTIRLTPWARVEGVFRVGPAPVANVKLTLDTSTIRSYGADVPNIFTHHEVTTGPEGQYVFERVIPGKGRIGRSILLTVENGAAEVTSSKRVAAQFPPGETTVLDLGGDGCAVVGRILPPPNLEQPPLWNFALVEVSAFLPPLDMPMAPPEVQNDPELYRAWRQEWEATPDGRAWRSAHDTYQALRAIVPHFTATVARDGTFRIDDVPSGSYVLSVRFSQHRAGRLGEYRFSVPAFDRDELAPLVDLGELQLQ